MARLTDRTVETARPSKTRRELPDDVLPGFYLVVQPSGARSWAVRYRAAGRTRKHTIGAYPKLGLKEARDLARTAIRSVAEGSDPHAIKVAAREAAKAVSAGTAPLTAESPFVDVWQVYIADHVKGLRPRSQEAINGMYRMELEPRWKKRRLGQITPADVTQLKRDLKKTPSKADKARVILSGFFNWCMDDEIHGGTPIIAESPVIASRKRRRNANDKRKAKTGRKLGDDEIRWMWTAADESGFPFGPLVKLLLLTGQRRNEVAGIAESEIDRPKRVWCLPGERTKNGEPNLIYLADLTLVVLDSLPNLHREAMERDRIKAARQRKNDQLLLSYNGTTPPSGFSKAKRRLDTRMLELAKQEAKARGYDSDMIEIKHWKLHDLRRTFISLLARLKIPQEYAEKAVNHISESHGGLRKIYDEHEYEEETRNAFVVLANFITSLVSGDPARNVVPLTISKHSLTNG
jgi:integrase